MKFTVLLALTALLAAVYPITPHVQAAASTPSNIIPREHSAALIAHYKTAEHPAQVHTPLLNRIQTTGGGPVFVGGSGGGCAEAGTVHEYAWGWRFYANSCLVGDLAGVSTPFPALSAAIANQCRLCVPLAPAIASVFVTQRPWVLRADAACGHRGVYVNGAWAVRQVWITVVC